MEGDRGGLSPTCTVTMANCLRSTRNELWAHSTHLVMLGTSCDAEWSRARTATAVRLTLRPDSILGEC